MTHKAFTTLQGMAEDYERLLIAAKQLRNLDGPAAVARHLGTYEQMLTNWKARGIPRAEIMDISHKIGCNSFWLRDGIGAMIDARESETANDILKMIEENPELIRLLKVAAPLDVYKIGVLVQTSTALAKPAEGTNGKQ